jgi:ATP-binding cassette subfamily B protein
MIQADYQIQGDDLFQAFPWNQLTTSCQTQLRSKFKHQSFRPGEMLYSLNEFPDAVHYILQGRVRILAATEDHPTLAILSAGSLVGWESFIRRVAVGSAQAMVVPGQDTGLHTIALPADDFETLVLPVLLPSFAQQWSAVELFDTLSRFLSQSPYSISGTLLKQLVERLEAHQWVQLRQVDWPIAQKSADCLPLISDRLWLVSGGDALNLPLGSRVKDLTQLHRLRPSPYPVRLLGVDRGLLQWVWQYGELPPASLFSSTQESAEDENAIAPDLDFSSAAWVSSAQLIPTPSQSYPVWKSSRPDPIEDIVACFGMVCDRLQVPFRPDYLRRWLQQRLTKGDTWMTEHDAYELFLRLAQAMGLNARIISCTLSANGLNRLPTPALLQCQTVFVVLYEITPNYAILGSPRTGLLKISPQELARRLGGQSSDTPSTGRAIALEMPQHHAMQNFGFQWFIPALKRQRVVLLQVLIASVFVQLLGIANPLLIQQVIDQVIVNANPGAMAMFGLLMILCAVFEGMLTVLRTYLFSSTASRLDLQLGIAIVHHLLHQPMQFFEKRPVGDLAARLNELENIRQFLTGTALTAVLDVVFSVFYLGVMVLYSIPLTFAVLVSIPIVIGSTLLVSTLQQKLLRLKSEQGAKVQSYLVEVLSGIFTVKAQHMESLVEATWRDRYVNYLTTGFKTSTVSTLFYSFNTFLNNVSNLFVLWVGAGLVLQGELTLGGLIAFRILTGYVTGPLVRLAGFWQRFQETALSMELLADIAEAPAEALTETASKPQLPPIQGQVQWQDVCFTFQPEQPPQLAHVNLHIAPGDFVGVVGQSGSGKSTLVKLLPRLYEPQSGRIAIDGYDIHKVDLSSLRQQIGIVPQDVLLFEGTIRDNIALFTNLADDAVIAAAKVAEAHDFIMQLPEGYATRVGERGSTLSGGQRQRIAIARVVARNPRLLIFDEATSALDYATERRVCENIMRHFHDRTCFFITHRLSAIVNADQVLVLQSGAIAEQGTHPELMAQRGLYYCLYQQQGQENSGK